MEETRTVSLTVKIDKVYGEDLSLIDSVCKIYLNNKRSGKIVLSKKQVNQVNQEDYDDYESRNSYKERNSYTIYIDSSIEFGDLLEIVCFQQNKYFNK
jgi:hypothetical protein